MQLLLPAEYYTVTANGNSFSVQVDILKAIQDGKMAHDNELYTYYYTGVLNADAKVYDEGKQENALILNTATIPMLTPRKERPPEKKVYDWTFKMGVSKVDETGKALTGAKFALSLKTAHSRLRIWGAMMKAFRLLSRVLSVW